jgi:N-acetylmuramoyl-L-alanine amidase
MRKAGVVGLVLLGLVTCYTMIQLFMPQSTAVFYPTKFGDQTLIIDAGHGGADGGAVSDSGTVESTLNLAIARKLNLLAGLYGVQTVMIRVDDNSVHDPSATTLREQKRSDLENRVALINSTPNGVLISIHQNILPGSSSRGTQVFYAGDNQLGERWATETQALVRTTLQPENSRQAAVISDSVYLMSHISCPAILVECGFLSNAQEEELLGDPTYQQKLAAVLLAGYLQGPVSP